MKIKKIKTLSESAKELKASVDALHRARIDFIKAYEASVDGLIDDEIMRDSFIEKFGERMTGGYRQSM